MQRLFLAILFTSWLAVGYGQTLNDAIRYTFHNQGGTARYLSTGGSMSAIGGDLSAISSNPAGLGVYKSTQYAVTLGWQNHQSSALYTNSVNTKLANKDYANLNLNNAGYVSAGRPIGLSWKTTNWAIGMNRLVDFNQDISYSGSNEGSLADRFLETAVDNGITDPWGDILADDVGMIYTGEDDQGTFLTNDVPSGAILNKTQTIQRRGALQELFVGFGGNYKDKLLLGAYVGFPFINFTEKKTYLEDDRDRDIPVYEQVSFEESLKTNGAGINAKVGLIYMPTRQMRVGLAVHSPTSYVLTDEFTADLSYRATDLSDPDNPFEGGTAESPQGESEYNFSTPWRFSGGLGYIIGRLGFISADIEYVDYASTGFNLNLNGNDPANQAFEDALNQEINSELGSAVHVRLGGELRLKPFKLRAGYTILGATLKNGKKRSFFSTGLGYNHRRFYVSLAVQQLAGFERYLPYTSRYSDDPVIEVSQSGYRALLTFGFR